MSDEYERLPGGGLISYSEIRNFRERKDFTVFDGEDIKVKFSEEILDAYNYYALIWDNCREFGLPNGGDWMNNPAWLISLVKMFNNLKVGLDNYRIEKQQR